LLVEDEILISEMMAAALAEEGFEVLAAANAEQALQYLQDGQHVDILFTDINLPGMDGSTLAARARELYPDLPVIYASGRWSLLATLGAMPRSGILPKPYSPTRACSMVESLLAAAH
jgi:CheY-like chemotaxis protein